MPSRTKLPMSALKKYCAFTNRKEMCWWGELTSTRTLKMWTWQRWIGSSWKTFRRPFVRSTRRYTRKQNRTNQVWSIALHCTSLEYMHSPPFPVLILTHTLYMFCILKLFWFIIHIHVMYVGKKQIIHAEMQAVRQKLGVAEGLCAQMPKSKSSSSTSQHAKSSKSSTSNGTGGSRDSRNLTQLQSRLQQLSPLIAEESAKKKTLAGRYIGIWILIYLYSSIC